MRVNKDLLKKISAYSSVAASVAALPKDSDAQIIYSDISPDFTLECAPHNYGFYDLDLNNDGVADFRIQKDNITTDCWFCSCSAGYSSCDYNGEIRIKALNDGSILANGNYPENLKLEDSIDANEEWI